MFQLAEMIRMVRVPPWLFGGTLDHAVSEELNNKLANKVVLDVGLCIALFDLVSLDDSYIFPGDGASHTRVTFRYIVFRPFMEEILEGVIKESNSEGLKVSLGFFEDIYIRKDSMMSNFRFDETEKSWVWDYQLEDKTHQLYMDIGEKVRLKVIEEQFTDTTPNNPNDKTSVDKEKDVTPSSSTTMSNPNDQSCGDKEKDSAPYIIYGAINEHGLGMVSWWTSGEAEEEEEEEEEEDEVIEGQLIKEES